MARLARPLESHENMSPTDLETANQLSSRNFPSSAVIIGRFRLDSGHQSIAYTKRHCSAVATNEERSREERFFKKTFPVGQKVQNNANEMKYGGYVRETGSPNS
jgi:hypothetical protein